MTEVTIVGKLLKGNETRDAIHIAVAPVIAGHALNPGESVGFAIPGNTEVVDSGANELIGIVDPFLTGIVNEGDKCWMFLNPNTITSLKHQWTHPAFEPEVVAAGKNLGDVAASEAWLRAFIATADCPDYDTVIAAAVGDHGKNCGEGGYMNSKVWDDGGEDSYLHFGGRDAHGQIPPEFWDHVEIVTGRKVPVRAKHFSCSC